MDLPTILEEEPELPLANPVYGRVGAVGLRLLIQHHGAGDGGDAASQQRIKGKSIRSVRRRAIREIDGVEDVGAAGKDRVRGLRAEADHRNELCADALDPFVDLSIAAAKVH